MSQPMRRVNQVAEELQEIGSFLYEFCALQQERVALVVSMFGEKKTLIIVRW